MTPPTDDRTARERAVEEARRRVAAWCPDMCEDGACPALADADALIVAVRQAERARVREAVASSPHVAVTKSILAAIDALPETP